MVPARKSLIQMTSTVQNGRLHVCHAHVLCNKVVYIKHLKNQICGFILEFFMKLSTALTTLDLVYVSFHPVSPCVDGVSGCRAVKPMYPDHLQLPFLCVTLIGPLVTALFTKPPDCLPPVGTLSRDRTCQVA